MKSCYNGKCETNQVLGDSGIFNPVGVALQLVTSRILSDSRTPVLRLNPLSTFARLGVHPDLFRKLSEVDSGFSFPGSMRMRRQRRNHTYSSEVSWSKLLMLYGNICAYCQEEPAQSVDHVIPYSYSEDNSLENLRPCCMWCNLHASDKFFSSFDEKQKFLISKRSGRSAASRTVCTTCFLPYQRPHMTTSMFECPICDPTKSKSAQIKEWSKFLDLMRSAGIKTYLHSTIRKMRRDGMNMKEAKRELGELYMVSIFGNSNDDFVLEDLEFWHVATVK